jgi:hypothetical protein
MLNSEIRSQTRRYTHTNATNYIDATLDADSNRSNGEIWMMILEAEGYKNTGGDFKVIDFTSNTGLVAQDLGYNGEFPFPAIAMTLEQVYLDYGDGPVKAEIIDKSEISSSMFDDADNSQYSETNPKVFLYRDSIFPRPLNLGTTVTDGIKLLVRARQDTLSGESTEPQFESNFHQLIPLKNTQDFYLEYPEKYNPRIDKKVNELEAQLISFYQDRSPLETRFKAVKETY